MSKVRSYVSGRAQARLLALCILPSHQTSADSIPNVFSGPSYYYSSSLDPITVNFVWPDNGHPDSRIRDTITIPRAYIITAGGYSSRPVRLAGKYTPKSSLKGYDVLPKTVLTDQIRLYVTYPDGHPYAIALSKWGREKRNSKFMGTRFYRAQSFIARVSYAPDAGANPTRNNTIAYEQGAPLTEGFGLLYNANKTLPVYFNVPGEKFFRARCNSQEPKIVPRYYCTYAVPLGKNYMADVGFLDFRAHGGRAFADRRIAAFRRAMCRYFPCDE